MKPRFVIADVRQFVLIAVCLSLISCGGGGGAVAPVLPPPALPVFQHDGLNGRIVTHIHARGNRLFATTDSGLYVRTLGQAGWAPQGLAGLRVQDLVFIDDLHWLAPVFATGANPFADPRLFESTDGGANWQMVANNFGGGATQSEGIYALFYDAVDQLLYGTGTDALASSSDFGRTWQLLLGDWDVVSGPKDALTMNPLTRQLWLGGQNAIEEMVLRRYDIATTATELYLRLLPSPATTKGITHDPNDRNRVLASGEGGIVQSFDNGGSWVNLLPGVGSRFYFQTALDPGNSAVIYTAGWDKIFDDPQPLILEISRNRGTTWVQHMFPDPQLFGGAWSLRAVTENGGTVLYIGLYRGGIMRVSLP